MALFWIGAGFLEILTILWSDDDEEAAVAAGAIPMTDSAETATAATRRLTNTVYLFASRGWVATDSL